MTKIQNFTDLTAWQEAHSLALDIYKITQKFPKEEILGLTSQMRRCAVSIPSNIAEGFNRLSKKEKIQFDSIAIGSSGELLSQLMLSKDLGYISHGEFLTISAQLELVRKLLAGLVRSLRA